MDTMTLEEYQRQYGQRDETRRRNRNNRREGEAFEERLRSYHEELRLTGQATVYKTNPNLRMTGRNTAVITGKGPCDFMAFLSSGAVVVFDAKSRAENAFSIGKDMAHQLEWLHTMARYGHAAGLLVYWKEHERVRWHPVASFDQRVRMADGLPVADVAWLPVVAGKDRR